MSQAEEKYATARDAAMLAIRRLYEAEQTVGFEADSIAEDLADVVFDATDGNVKLTVE